jgi:trk system potassium uptake protein TrkA
MKKKEKTNKNLYMIIGCGNLGANLALSLSQQNEDVIIIDKNKGSFNKLGNNFSGLSLEGDATDFDFLRENSIEKAGVIIIVTNNDNTNIMVAQIAKEMFNIKKVIARLYDSERENVYKEFDIDTICPEVLSAMEIKRLLKQEN